MRIVSSSAPALQEISMNNDSAKILAMAVLGLGSFFFGIIPAFVSQQNRTRHPFIITILLCFGAGVLLATSIVHMLAETREDLKGYAEIIFCIGFFIVYTVDELVHYFIQGSRANTPATPILIVGDHMRPSTSQYGALDTQSRSVLDGDHNAINRKPSTTKSTDSASDETVQSTAASSHHNQHVNQDVNDHHHHNTTGQISLLAALTLHTFIEGLAIGVQMTAAKVLLLVGAVCVHKFVVGFCLGVEICSIRRATVRKHLLAVFLFSFGSVLGIICGMSVVDFENSQAAVLVPILQGLAGGTLLYVTVSEVLPREKAKWHMHRAKRAAGLIQLIAVGIGFSTMAILNFYFND